MVPGLAVDRAESRQLFEVIRRCPDGPSWMESVRSFINSFLCGKWCQLLGNLRSAEAPRFLMSSSSAEANAPRDCEGLQGSGLGNDFQVTDAPANCHTELMSVDNASKE